MTKLLCFGILLTAGATHGEGTTAKNSIPWSQIGAKAGVDYNGDGLAVTPTESGARLHCVFQRLDGEATSQGLWLTSTVTDTVSDRFRITAMAVGRIADGPLTPCLSPSDGVRVAARPGEGQLPRTGSVSVTGQTVRFSRPGLTEEYSVSMDGVRQDFIVGESFGRARLRQSRPSRQSAGYLVVKLAVTGAKVESAACGARLVLENSGRKIAYSRLRVTDATGKELRARIEVCPADDEEPSFTSWSESSPLFEQLSLFTAVATEAQEALAVVVDDADAVYPVRIDPTFGDANWVSMGVPPGVTGAVYAAVVDASGNLYIGGGFIFMTAGGVSATNIAQWNGSSWSALGSGVGGMNDWVDALAVSGSTLYAGGSFANAGGLAVTNIAQWNGSSWSALGSGLDGLIGVSALAVSGSTLYAGGRFGIEQWNGSSWSALGSGLNGGVGALAVSGSNLYAGGGFTTAGGVSANNIAQWNGSSWSALGSGINGGVRALAVSGSNLYAGGYFTTAGGVSATNIARWNGSSWSALGSGVSGGVVDALAVSGGTLYAGGDFLAAGGVEGIGIAQWNGSTWSAVGSGLNGPVYALAVSGGTLYAGGQFTTAGGMSATNIAQWNGSTWSAVGSQVVGMDGAVFALAVSGSTLYAGGNMGAPREGSGIWTNYIARWNGRSWSALALPMDLGTDYYFGEAFDVYALAVSGSTLYVGGDYGIEQWNGSSWSGPEVYGDVYALAVSGDTLYVGGGFQVPIEPTNYNYIAQWNGSSWSALGSGMNGPVLALAVSGGTLYAGGAFTMAGGVSATNIAQWNGSSWSALGSGVNGDSSGSAMPSGVYGMYGSVTALAVSGSTLYAGGYFTTAGGVSANNIAQWNGSSWSALGSGLSGEVVYGLEVDALAVSGGTLYVGGDFTTAGTNISAYAAEAIVGASPPPTDYTISVSALPPNEGTASGAGTFPSGSAKTVTAEANSGYAFVDWTENGTVVSSSNSYTFTLNGNVNLVANFTGGSGVSAFQTLDVPNNVGSTSALGVSGGSIVGNYGDNNGFLFNGNSYTTVDVPNPTAPDVPATTIATGISGSNIVGWFTDDAADAHGFLYSNGNFTTLDDPNAASSDNVGTYPPGGYGYILFSTEFDGYGGTFASGISGGNIVGWYVDMSGDTHGFLYNGSTYATLDDPNGVGSTYAQGISGNNIVGFYTDHTGKTHGFLYNGKTYTTLDAPGGVGATYAQGIDGNNIVGWYVNSTTGDHGFLYNGASYTTFDVPNAGGGGSTFAQGISGNTVVGWYFDSNANNHGFSYNTTPGGKDTITLSASPSAGGKVSGAGAFAAGSSVTVTATANGGYTFANWTENGSVISSNASYTFTVNENQTLVANFAIKGNPKLTITAPKSGQSVSNALLPVVGTVTDKVAVDDVYYQLNNTGWTLATSSNSWSNWAGTVTLVPGSNAISAYAVDASGAFSATNTNHVVYVVTGELQVTMVPPTATNLGAQWRVDGGAFHKSGVIVSNLLVGNHTLFFKSVPGFATPSNQAVSIASNQVTLATGAYLDTTQPTLTILSPTANLRVSNAVFTVTGKAADNVAVSNVLYQLNNDGWSNAGSTNHWTNWTASITSAPGSNTLQACAVDTSANYSLTNTVHFTYIPSATLTVRTNGLGSITPVDNGKLLAIGTNYAVKAAPANNWLFSNWLGGATAPYPALTNGPTLTFAMQSNLVLEANFVTNPFPAIAGSFNGLFYQTNGSPVTEQSSGFATITIASTSKGAYTAKLLLDGGSYSFTGAFDLNGNSVTNLTRRGESPLTVTLHVNLNTLPPATVMTGAVTATNWAGHSGLVADLAVFNGKTIVASNYAGKYTLVLPGSATPATSPGGYGAATFTNNLAGAAVLGGALGDGTSLGSQSVPISQDGLVPVYVPLYSGQGSVFGWLAFSNLPPKTVSGDLTWFKLSGPAKSLYTNGFTNQGAIIGSVYMPSTTNILALTNGTLTITDPGQNIDLVYTNVTVISNKLTYTAPPTNQLIVTFTPPSGAITVSFRPTGAKANITAQGVVLQGAPTDPSLKAAGWFTGTNETGSFQLRGQ